MKVTETKVGKILQKERYVIPIFQRNYSWVEPQWQKLWDDLVLLGEKKKKTHFFGTIVFIDKGKKHELWDEVELIDGQQRLTTCLIIMKCLQIRMEAITKNSGDHYLFNFIRHEDRYEGDSQFRLILRKKDKETLNLFINDEIEKIPEKYLSKSILNAIEFFNKKLETVHLNPHEIEIALESLRVAEIVLDSTDDDPGNIFETINSTGKELEAFDRIRNFIMLKIETKELLSELYYKYWEPMEDLYDKYDNLSFDNFFWDFLSMENVKGLKKRDLYGPFKRYYELKVHNNPTLEGFLKNIYDYSKFYCILKKPWDQDLEHDDQEIQTDIRDLETLRTLTIFPFTLRLLHEYNFHNLDKQKFRNLAILSQSYVVRRRVCRTRGRDIRKNYVMLLQNVSDKHGDKFYDSVLKFYKEISEPETAVSLKFPNDEEFLENFKFFDVYSDDTSKHILRRFENNIRNPEDALKDNVWEIEHVMPVSATRVKDWKHYLGSSQKERRDNHATFKNTIGNLTILKAKPNKTVSNKYFAEKKSLEKYGYKNSPFLMTQEIYRYEGNWDIEKIRKRCDEFSEEALKIWPSPFSPNF